MTTSSSDLTRNLQRLAGHLQEVAVDVAAVAGSIATLPTPPTPLRHPTDVVPEFLRWTTMTTTGSEGDPDNEFYIGCSLPHVYYVGSDGGVTFDCDVNGYHSKGSRFPRVENRMQSDKPNQWSPKSAWSSSGNHKLSAELSIDTSKLSARKRGNAIQIHDGNDDVCQIMKHETWGLGLMHSDGKKWESIDPNYKDGTRFACEVAAVASRITVLYNGVKKVDIAKAGSGWFWKIGAYAQTGGASEFTEPAGARYVVKVFSCTVLGGAF